MSRTRQGLLLALGAYLSWSLMSIYWKFLSDINSYETLSYRILFTSLTLGLYFLLTGKVKKCKQEISSLYKNPKQFRSMVTASLLISINWLTYIIAIGQGKATEASLGYYLMPICSTFLSVIFLKEKLDTLMKVAIGLAGVGVVCLLVQAGHLPIYALLLALSFSLYGLIKKQVILSSDVAMFLEASFLLPLVLLYFGIAVEQPLWSYPLKEICLLVLSGIITAIPLLLFSEGVKRAPLNLVCFIQYINPTIQLLIAISLFGEAILPQQFLGFCFIWLAILVFIGGQILMYRKNK